jgi:hypothetical protein
MILNKYPGMHWSLKWYFNLILLLCFGAIVLVLGFIQGSYQPIHLAISAGLGLITGIFQLVISLGQKAELREANTPLTVRRVLDQHKLGKVYFALLWGSVLVIFLIGFLAFSMQAVEIAVGLMGYYFLRELISFPGGLVVNFGGAPPFNLRDRIAFLGLHQFFASDQNLKQNLIPVP